MPVRRRFEMDGSTDDLGDNLFTPRTPPPTYGPTNENPTGMPGSEGNPNTGVAGGSVPPPPQGPQLPDVPIVGTGTQSSQGPVSTALPTWNAGAKAGQGSTILGFDSAKLRDPNSGSAAGSKYTDASKAFAESINQDVGWTRGSGNENAINFLRANGFENAKMVGDDKVDFGDGMGPIDIFRSDGALVFQNTTGNPVWEGQGYQPDTLGGPTPGGQPGVQMRTPGTSPSGGWSPYGVSGQPTPRPLDGVPGETRVQVGDDFGQGKDDPHQVQKILDALLQGNLNQGIVDRRVDSARDDLNRQRASSVDTLGAALAERGQLGSGAGDSAAFRLDESLGDIFGQEVNDIYANEGENADERMMQALITQAGLDEGDANRLIEAFKAQTGRLDSDRDFSLGQGRLSLDEALGMGDLDVRRRGLDQDFILGNRDLDVRSQLGNRGISSQEFLTTRGQDQEWSQFLGRLGLDRDQLGLDSGNADWDHILRLLELQLGGANVSADGYI